jgi:hypothetical protein
MLQGLALVVGGQPPATALLPRAERVAPLPTEHAFVRLLANLVLRTQTELSHVY